MTKICFYTKFDNFLFIEVLEYQSGFRQKQSCQRALTCFVDRLLSSINDSELSGVTLFGLKKCLSPTSLTIRFY